MLTFKVGPDRKLIPVFACDEAEAEPEGADEELSPARLDAAPGFLPEGGVSV